MLSNEQIKSYHKNGFLAIDSVFTKKEIDFLNGRIKDFEKFKKEPNIICEENGSIRSIFAPETQDKAYEGLIKDKRILKSVEQLLEDKIYLYQYKLNLKEGFKGKNWEWHQDFPYWYYGDGIQKPNILSVMILLTDVASYQGPLLLIPKSHKDGIVDFNQKKHLYGNNSIENSLNADLRYTIDNDLVNKLATENDIASFEGKRGSVLFFHANIFHASNTNVSPFTRNTAILTYNSVNNSPKKVSERPEYICYRNFNPLLID